MNINYYIGRRYISCDFQGKFVGYFINSYSECGKNCTRSNCKFISLQFTVPLIYFLESDPLSNIKKAKTSSENRSNSKSYEGATNS
jgi:hypothetical protein